VSETDTAQGKEFTGRHMLLLAVTFFGVIIAVNVGMSILAYRSWTGLVVENSYVASQEFETKRIAHEKQVAAGWQSTLTIDDATVKLEVVDATGKQVDLGTVSLLVSRPVGGHDDQTVTLERMADGYAATLLLAPGIWDAAIDAPETNLGPFELYERFKVSP
jgi:nitrogen fixation protein FixH